MCGRERERAAVLCSSATGADLLGAARSCSDLLGAHLEYNLPVTHLFNAYPPGVSGLVYLPVPVTTDPTGGRETLVTPRVLLITMVTPGGGLQRGAVWAHLARCWRAALTALLLIGAHWSERGQAKGKHLKISLKYVSRKKKKLSPTNPQVVRHTQQIAMC